MKTCESITQTISAMTAQTARIAAIAQSACADCLTMQKRIDELEGALTDAEFLLRKVGINWKEAGSMKA